MHACDGQTDGRTDGIYAVARKNSSKSIHSSLRCIAKCQFTSLLTNGKEFWKMIQNPRKKFGSPPTCNLWATLDTIFCIHRQTDTDTHNRKNTEPSAEVTNQLLLRNLFKAVRLNNAVADYRLCCVWSLERTFEHSLVQSWQNTSISRWLTYRLAVRVHSCNDFASDNVEANLHINLLLYHNW